MTGYSASSFKGKVAIVTGSSMGIGKAIAKVLCIRGASVVLNGRDPGKLEKALGELTSEGFSASSFAADVTVYSECKALVDFAVEKYGRLDIMVANAGIVGFSPFEDFEPENFRKALESNLYGSVYSAKAALAEIKKTKGSIVFISSLAGMMGMPYYSAYSTGKMALTAFSQSIRSELKESGIHVGIVYVSFTVNEEEKRFLGPDGKLIPVPPRKKWLQQPREKVAESVVNLIARRRNSVVLSGMGKLNSFIVRFFPFITRAVLEKSSKKDLVSLRAHY